jgi:hypothetical protein
MITTYEEAVTGLAEAENWHKPTFSGGENGGVDSPASTRWTAWGGLVALSERNRLARVMAQALRRAARCSSDPICATRTPRIPRTSCMARPATRVRWRRKPHASARPGSSTVGCSSTCPEAMSGSSDPLPDPGVARQLGAMLTGTEARQVADRLASGETLTSVVRAVDGDRRVEVPTLLRAACLEPASRAGMVGLLRAVEGSRSVTRKLDPRWTMPGQLARGGPLHSSVTHLVARARHTVTCSTFNIERSSRLWPAPRGAARRPEVSLRVYLDTRAANADSTPWLPTTAEVAAHLHPGVVLRTAMFDGTPVRNNAKFPAIDHRFLLVTSANFSWSAEHGNLELGVLIDDPNLAEAVETELHRAEDILYEPIRRDP